MKSVVDQYRASMELVPTPERIAGQTVGKQFIDSCAYHDKNKQDFLDAFNAIAGLYGYVITTKKHLDEMEGGAYAACMSR